MTTVAFRDGILAWDSQWTDEESGFKYFNRKGWKDEKAGAIVCGAGSVEVAFEVLRGIFTDDPQEIRRHKSEDLDLVVLWNDGRLEVYDEYGRCVPFDTSYFYAWGSGAKPALAAMHMGATAAGAVAVAAKVDLYTGGPIHEESW